MTKNKLKTVLVTILVILAFFGVGYVYFNYQMQSLYVLMGVLILIFIRHTYVVVDHLLIKD
jgi:hypothetical protein